MAAVWQGWILLKDWRNKNGEIFLFTHFEIENEKEQHGFLISTWWDEWKSNI